VGVVTIASPTTPLARVITDGVNGYTSGPHEWDAKIAGVIEMIDQDPGAYREMAERAAADALGRYAWDSQAHAIAAAVFGEAPVPHSGEPARGGKGRLGG
jgi:glycosyltransferase involved in cell wall biosynthesis